MKNNFSTTIPDFRLRLVENFSEYNRYSSKFFTASRTKIENFVTKIIIHNVLK